MGTREDRDFLSPAILFFKGQISLGDNYQIDVVVNRHSERSAVSTVCWRSLVLVLKHLCCSVTQSKKYETNPRCLTGTWQE